MPDPAQATELAQQLNTLITGLTSTVGGIIVTIACFWIWNNKKADKRAKAKAEEPEAEGTPVTRSSASFLVEKLADLDRHTRSGLHETLAGLNAVGNTIGRVSEQVDRLDRAWTEELRDLREQIEKMPEQVQLRIEAAQARHGR